METQNAENEVIGQPAAESQAELLALDGPRVIAAGGERFIFRRITADDHRKFYTRDMECTVAQLGDGWFDERLGLAPACLALYEAAIQRAECEEEIADDEKANIASWLTSAFATGVHSRAGKKCVELESVWTESHDQPGSMKKFSGLRHIFKTPDLGHRMRFLGEQTRSRSKPLAETKTTKIVFWQEEAESFYDELIEEAEGYSLAGRELRREEIVREMDPFHKAAAVAALFPISSKKKLQIQVTG